MPLFRCILVVAIALFGPIASFETRGAEAAAEPHMTQATPADLAKSHEPAVEHEKGLPLYATPIFHIGPLPVTNSMIVTWAVALLLIIGAQMATRNIKDVPDGSQNFWEWLVEGLYNFLEGIIGYELAKKTFWFFATIFIL